MSQVQSAPHTCDSCRSVVEEGQRSVWPARHIAPNPGAASSKRARLGSNYSSRLGCKSIVQKLIAKSTFFSLANVSRMGNDRYSRLYGSMYVMQSERDGTAATICFTVSTAGPGKDFASALSACSLRTQAATRSASGSPTNIFVSGASLARLRHATTAPPSSGKE